MLPSSSRRSGNLVISRLWSGLLRLAIKPVAMSKQRERLEDRLASMEVHLADIARTARVLVQSGFLDAIMSYVSENKSARSSFEQPEPKLYIRDVLEYLGISERTYYRKVTEGKLIPRKWEGPDYFYPSDLESERDESIRRGRL